MATSSILVVIFDEYLTGFLIHNIPKRVLVGQEAYALQLPEDRDTKESPILGFYGWLKADGDVVGITFLPNAEGDAFGQQVRALRRPYLKNHLMGGGIDILFQGKSGAGDASDFGNNAALVSQNKKIALTFDTYGLDSAGLRALKQSRLTWINPKVEY